MFREVRGFRPHGADSFIKWVYIILKHKLIDAQRAAHRRVRDVAREVPAHAATGPDSYWNLLDHVYADSQTPSRIVRREEALGALLACVSGLLPAHRQVIHLRFLEGQSVAEVAARLDKSESAIVALTKRALDALRESMNRLGEFTHGG